MNKILCLLIEDDKTNITFIRRVLESMNINTITANDGIEAVELFKSGKDDIDFNTIIRCNCINIHTL
jgi:CheY-like chemotaxis protein